MKAFATALFAAAASAAPSELLLNNAWAGAPIAAAGYAGIAAAPAAVGYAGIAAAAPVAVAAAPAISVPAPYTTEEVRGAPVTAIQQPAPIVSKQVHLGQTTYVSGHRAEIIKPPTPVLPIAVPTALKGSVSYNAPIVKVAKELHTVNEPVPVERPYAAPYDVPVYEEQIIEVPTPVEVAKPYAVPYAVPVQGEPIINIRKTAPIVQRTHSTSVAAPAFAAAPVAAYAGVAAAPAYAGVAAAPAALGYGYAGLAGAAIADPAWA